MRPLEILLVTQTKNRDLPLVDLWIWRQLWSSSAPLSILVLNCRGLRTDSTVGELKCLVKKYRPQLLCLSETKMMGNKAENFMWSFGFDCSIPVTALHLVVDFVLEVHS
jgi:hypothetical protein